jgi:hypothetical protein
MVADVNEAVVVADVDEAMAADVDECSDNDDDPVIRNLNRMSELNLR